MPDKFDLTDNCYRAYHFNDFLEVKYTGSEHREAANGSTMIYCGKFHHKKDKFGWQIEVAPLANGLYTCWMMDTCTRLKPTEDHHRYYFYRVGTIDEVCKWLSDEFECLERLEEIDKKELNPNNANLIHSYFVNENPEIAKYYIKWCPADFHDDIKFIDENFQSREEWEKLINEGYKPINDFSDLRLQELDVIKKVDKYCYEKIDQTLFNNSAKDYVIESNNYKNLEWRYTIKMENEVEIEIKIGHNPNSRNSNDMIFKYSGEFKIYDEKDPKYYGIKNVGETWSFDKDVLFNGKYKEVFSEIFDNLDKQLNQKTYLVQHDTEHFEQALDSRICEDNHFTVNEEMIKTNKWVREFLRDVKLSMGIIEYDAENIKLLNVKNWEDVKEAFKENDCGIKYLGREKADIGYLTNYVAAQKTCELFLKEFIPLTEKEGVRDEKLNKVLDKFYEKFNIKEFKENFNKLKNDIAIERANEAIENLKEREQIFEK